LSRGIPPNRYMHVSSRTWCSSIPSRTEWSRGPRSSDRMIPPSRGRLWGSSSVNAGRKPCNLRFFDSFNPAVLLADDHSLSVDGVNQCRYHFLHWSSYRQRPNGSSGASGLKVRSNDPSVSVTSVKCLSTGLFGFPFAAFG
jgi:hypothetical protein